MTSEATSVGVWDENAAPSPPPEFADAVEAYIDELAEITDVPRHLLADRIAYALRDEWVPLTRADLERYEAEERLLAPPVRLGREARRACARRGHTPKTHDGALYCADCGEEITPDNGLEVRA